MAETFWFSLKPKSPIHIGLPKPNFNFLPTNTVIPGSVIRGALAEFLLAQRRENKIKEFIDDMRFGFFFPAMPAVVSNVASLPFPITTLTCKSHRGFKSKNGHGIFDTLLAAVAYEELKRSRVRLPVPLSFKCPDCQDRMDFISGFYSNKNGFEMVEVKKHSQTKVAVNRRRKVAEREMLYAVTAIKPEKVEFLGRVIGKEEKIKLLEKALLEMGIGAFTTRGYGQIEVTRTDVKTENLQDRIQLFNQKLKEVWGDLLSIMGEKKPCEGTYFSVDFLSPGILNKRSIPTLKLSLEVGGEEWEPIYWVAQPTFVSGWSTAWGLPKETELGVGIGSTYVFKVQGDIREYLQEFERLEKEGIGERTEEGYGEISICHLFHKEVYPV